jgi:hypothetical protein
MGGQDVNGGIIVSKQFPPVDKAFWYSKIYGGIG